MPFEKGNKLAEKWTEEKALQLADELITWLKEEDNIYFEEFLVLEKEMYGTSLNYLKKKYPMFSKRIKLAKKIQKVKLIKYATEERINPPFTKFILSVTHGMHEKKIIDQNNTGQPTIVIENHSKLQDNGN